MSPQVTYVVLPTNNAYTCEVILPERSPIRGLVGSPATQKSLAKQSAAFDTCLLLRKNNLLDDHFKSIYYKRLPIMRNAKLAINSKKTSQYDMISKPSFWVKGRGTIPEVIYATVLVLIPSRILTRDHQSLIFLTRERLPEFPKFSLYLEDDIETEVISLPMKEALAVSESDLEALTTFTLRVFRDVFHKTYEPQPEMMPYWLAPGATCSMKNQENLDPRDVIDWTTLQFVQANDELLWSDDKPPEFLADRFIFDKWDGRYRYFTFAIDSTLRASDPPPSFLPRRRHMDNILSYCLSLYKNARKHFLETCNWNQPVVRAELVRLRRNLLDKMSDQERKVETRCVICPEPLKISAVSQTCDGRTRFVC